MLNRRQLLQIGAAAALGACTGASDPVRERALGEDLFRRGARWLWKQQRKDGGFLAETWGPARRASATALVLLCSSSLPRERFPYPRHAALRASDWILGQLGKSGALGLSGPDAPVYTTATALHAFWRLRPPDFGDKSYPMLWWLRGQQLSAANGWGGHPAQGGFPVGGFDPHRPDPFSDDAPPVDLALTRAVTEAMAAVGIHGRDPAMVQARGFAARCRRPDGTYATSPLQQASTDDATLDALRLHIACGLPHAELQAMAEPLHRADAAPVAPTRFADWAGAARAFQHLGAPPGWADALIRALAEAQDSEGWWQSPAPDAHEDDPLIATALALSALGSALRSSPRPMRQATG